MYLRGISDVLVYGNAYLFQLVLLRPLENGGDSPLYMDMDTIYMDDLNLQLSMNTVVCPLLNRLAEQEEEDWEDSVTSSG